MEKRTKANQTSFSLTPVEREALTYLQEYPGGWVIASKCREFIVREARERGWEPHREKGETV